MLNRNTNQFTEVPEASAKPAETVAESEAKANDERSSREQLEKVIVHVGSQVGELAINIADTSGTVNDVAKDLTKQTDAFGKVASAVNKITKSSTDMAVVLNGVCETASHVHAGIGESTSLVEKIFTDSSQAISDMAKSSEVIVTELDDVTVKISNVHEFTESIQKIATETQMLAINAGIMAARAGDEGKGFGIIAESVQKLAQQTSDVSKNMSKQLNALETTINELLEYRDVNNKVVLEARGQSEKIDAEFAKFRNFGAEVESLTDSISQLSKPVTENVEVCTHVLKRMQDLNEEAKWNANALEDTTGKFDSLVTFTEEMILLIEESGIETEDSAIIRHTIAAAKQTAEIFEDAVRFGRISMSQLFDERYRPLANTNPQQVVTEFTRFTDTVMPTIQEPFLSVDPRIAFCAAVDRNGYLPTHNKIYSKPQSNDPVWNAANCRNRRIFDDRTGLNAGRNTKPFILQTYRRDMGGGEFILMKDLSAPIYVNGRHWGGLRVGFKVA